MIPNPKQHFLDAYGKEHATTMRVVRAFPASKRDLRPHPKCKTAAELAHEEKALISHRAKALKILRSRLYEKQQAEQARGAGEGCGRTA